MHSQEIFVDSIQGEHETAHGDSSGGYTCVVSTCRISPDICHFDICATVRRLIDTDKSANTGDTVQKYARAATIQEPG